MARYIKVTPDEVRAARIRVQALRSAGLEPDPTVVKIANAPRLSGKWVKEQERLEQSTRPGARRLNVEQGLSPRIQSQFVSGEETMAQLASFRTLTLRERRIIAMRVAGATNKDIATRLSISVAAVQGHIDKIAGQAKNAGLQSSSPDRWMVKLAEAMHIPVEYEDNIIREETEPNSQ